MELSVKEIRQRIYQVRGQQVVLDNDLAMFFQTKTKTLNQAVRRNASRFPEDFVIHLTTQELAAIRLQVGLVDGTQNHGGRRYLPYGFTQEGVSMLSGVLNSERAIQVNILIMRAFVQLRQISEERLDLAKRFDQLERICMDQFKFISEFIQRPTNTPSYHGIPVASLLPQNLPGERISEISDTDHFTFERKIQLKVGTIQDAVAQHYQISIGDLKAATRVPSIALPRQLCMYLIRRYTGLSYKSIGMSLGGRDHTTVLHACKKIEVELSRCPDLMAAKETIQSLLTLKGISLK